MRIPRCVDPDCRNNNQKTKSKFCSICKAKTFLKFKESKKILRYILYNKMDNVELFDMVSKHKLRFNPISQQSFQHRISISYLRLLLNLKPDQNINSLLQDYMQCAYYSAELNGWNIIWLNFDSSNYMFVPEGFQFTRIRQKGKTDNE